MATENLPTGNATGAQANTQNPQTSAQNSLANQNGSGIQRGTAASVLTSKDGVTLNNVNVTTLKLTSTTGATNAATTTPANQHNINPVFLGFSLLLFVVAIVLFIKTASTEKTTTK